MPRLDWSEPQHHISRKPQGLTSHLLRFHRSPHSKDLLLIGFLAMGVVVYTAISMIPAQWLSPPASPTPWFQRLLEKPVDQSIPTEFRIAVLGVALGIVGWAYQSANIRFGVADLFAAEIVTICRVGAVSDFMPKYVRLFDGGTSFPPFASAQDYLVVFDNNAKDLEVLDGDVVRFVTQFYIYMKALQDTLTRGADAASAAWRASALTIIYNAFLAFESARQAITVLLDDRNERQEYVLTALLSEIPAYLLLLKEIDPKTDSLRYQRIQARREPYANLMRDIRRDLPNIKPPCQDFADRILRLWERSVAEDGTVSLPPWLRAPVRQEAAN